MFTRLASAAAALLITSGLALGLVLLATLPTPARAATLPVPTVEYSADRVMETDQGTFEGKVYAARDKERSETSMGGMSTAMILRRDRNLAWMLMPAQKMYREMDFDVAEQQSGSKPADDVSITEVGTETVEGQTTTKYKLLMKDGSAGGFLWITRDGIVMKMDTVMKNGREKTRYTMTLRNLQIGPQDPAVFELPAGYSAMPSFGGKGGLGMPGMGGNRRGGVFGN